MKTTNLLVSLLCFFLLAAPVLALDNEDYRASTNAERTVNVTWGENSTAFFPSINNDCAGNTCRYTYYETAYNIPDDHIRTEEPRWLVKHGGLDPYNVSVGSAYNATHYLVRMVAVYHSSGGFDIGSGVGYHDGAAWKWLGSNESATPGSMAGTAADADDLSDGDWNSGAFSTHTDSGVEDFDTDATEKEANLYEQRLYWATGEPVEVLFTIRNQYGNPVENATVTATRQADNITLEPETTDLSGKVRFDMGDDIYYTINVTSPGYQNFSGTLHVLETSYSITITAATYSGSAYETIFANLTFITSPADNPPAAVTNFTLNVNDSLNKLLEYGIRTNFNGSLYEVNGSASGGGFLNLTMNLTAFEGSTIILYYWFDVNGSGVYTKWQPFLIGGVGYNDTSIQGITEDFLGGMDPLGRALIGTFAIVIIIVMLSAIGLPGSWTAAAAIPMFVMGGVLGYFDPVVSVMTAIVLTGVVILSNKGGLG